MMHVRVASQMYTCIQTNRADTCFRIIYGQSVPTIKFTCTRGKMAAGKLIFASKFIAVMYYIESATKRLKQSV